MIKPTKTTVLPASSSTSTITRIDVDTGAINIRTSGNPDSRIPDLNPQPGTSTSLPARTEVVDEPRVVVSYISDPIITEANARLAEIALPGLQTHLLQPHESVDGLFIAPSGQTYAHLEEGRYYRVELNADGHYQIPWPAAPGVTPPILKQIPGQSRWRIEAQWYSSESVQGSLFMHRLTADEPLAIFHVDPNLATLLPGAHESVDGIRKGPRGKIYVDLADGTVMVRKNEQGEYKLASATTINLPDITLEQIPGQSLWRRQVADISAAQHTSPAYSAAVAASRVDAEPGPGKRARLGGESDPAVTLTSAIRIEDWKTWGAATKPLVGDSIEIEGLHFPILAQPTHATDSLAFIKHPQFAATRFDAFERMLLTTPQLQPRGVVKLADKWTGRGADTWRIVEGLPFGKTLTQAVSDQFPYLSYDCANRVAREIFNRASHSDEITGPGVSALFETFKYWENRPVSVDDKRVLRQDLSDPLMLLTPQSTDANGYFQLPQPSAEGLQRIDFNPLLFAGSQYHVSRPSVRSLLTGILRGHGYQVSEDFRRNARDALLIKRRGLDSVFVLFPVHFPSQHMNAIDPVTWLKKRALVNKIEVHHKITLQDHHAANKIIYLAGANMPIEGSGENNLVIIRVK
jgi:hypothetical protein